MDRDDGWPQACTLCVYSRDERLKVGDGLVKRILSRSQYLTHPLGERLESSSDLLLTRADKNAHASQ